MGEAAFWGFIAASSLIAGGLISFAFAMARRTVGLIMAFGSGVLLSAVAYELVLEALENSDGISVTLGLATGALTFSLGDWWINQRGGAKRKDIGGGGAEGSAVSIVLGTLLDGIPESFILGLGLVTGGSISVAYLAAVFLSNLPEAIAASSGLKLGGWSRARVTEMWTGIAILSAVSSGLGYVVFSNTSDKSGSIVMAFAGGAVLTMLANTMIPEAYEEGGKLVGIVTVIGFTLAVLLSTVE
jgi:ZIP family zinc transporter